MAQFHLKFKWVLVLITSILLVFPLYSQKKQKLHFLQNADTLHKKRLWISASTGFAIYAGTSIGLWQAWYQNNELREFHLFDDLGEWNQYDKAGHLMAAYGETYFAYKGAKWTGMKKKPALWTAFGVGAGIQATIEIMDGFSEKWGFSVGDIAFNTAGSAIFVIQEAKWDEQRIVFKASTNKFDYPNSFAESNGVQYSVKRRANELYGTGPFEKFFKDYNEQNVWASINVWSFLNEREKSKFPKWLNIAAGYGVGNVYGGFDNTWEDNEGNVFNISNEYPRYRQYLLAFDVDTSKLNIKNRYLKTLVKSLNWIKIPSPALEYNTLGQLKFHPIYW